MNQKGFTLIELSIVLVIIGFIVGGVLVGQDLIRAAAVRAQISQIEKYQAAVNTFKSKYGYLPGDIKHPDATQFGFFARGLYAGQGDGDGGISGNWNGASNGICVVCQGGGETALFWRDLTVANLIEQSFNTATSGLSGNISSANIQKYLPSAQIGRGNYVYVYEGSIPVSILPSGLNYFSVSSVSGIGNNCAECLASTPGIAVMEAFLIDSKIDDGLPQSGNVTAQYVNGYQVKGKFGLL